jgi:enoyl-CoA hydratase
MEYKILQPDFQGGTVVLTISRPEAMNALNTLFFAEMNHFLNDLRERTEAQVLIITGAGKAFVAGADISEMVDMDQTQGEAFSRTGQATFRALEELEMPVIAAVNGFALGGGCELAMACDFRIASSKAKFGQPEVNLGLIPGYAGTQRLARLTGLADALYLLFTADMITAEEALRIGLVQKVTEPENLMTEALAIAAKIASKGPRAVKLIKSVTRQGLLQGFEEGCSLEAREFSSLFGNEGEEGMRAFLEKRNPVWNT